MARLILLSQPEFSGAAAGPLRAAARNLDLRVAATLPALESALADAPKNVRLVAFGSGVIVPASMLAALGAGAYNFHPGPPGYPGLFPSVFALYDRAAEFGVTLHEMATEIDSGPIIAVDNFKIQPDWDRLALDRAAFHFLLALLERFATRLTDMSAPLAPIPQPWNGPRRTRKDFEALCRLPDDVTADEFARRYRAVGEGPEHALAFTRFGRTFRLENALGGDVVRGGQPVST